MCLCEKCHLLSASAAGPAMDTTPTASARQAAGISDGWVRNIQVYDSGFTAACVNPRLQTHTSQRLSSNAGGEGGGDCAAATCSITNPAPVKSWHVLFN